MIDRARDVAGWAVLDAALAHAREVLGGRLVAVYAVGSLTHGGFAPDVSDVDGVLVVDRCDAAIPEAVAEITRRTGAERLSLFWTDWATFGDPPQTARLPPIVALDLLDHGVALLGGASPADLPRPTHDDLLAESAAFVAQRIRDAPAPDPHALLVAGRRTLTKTVLFPVRFLATAHAGLAGSNDEAVAWYVADGRPHAPLVTAALAWRTTPIEDEPQALALLQAHLPGLYAEVLRTYS